MNKGLDVKYSLYPGESVIEDIMKIMEDTLSEPYSIYTYRYFLPETPNVSLIATVDGKVIGAAINRVGEKDGEKIGNIGMVGVLPEYRGKGIGRELCVRSLDLFRKENIKDIFLETEVHNYSALSLYESLGFVRSKYLLNYYTTKEDAFRLHLYLK